MSSPRALAPKSRIEPHHKLTTLAAFPCRSPTTPPLSLLFPVGGVGGVSLGRHDQVRQAAGADPRRHPDCGCPEHHVHEGIWFHFLHLVFPIKILPGSQRPNMKAVVGFARGTGVVVAYIQIGEAGQPFAWVKHPPLPRAPPSTHTRTCTVDRARLDGFPSTPAWQGPRDGHLWALKLIIFFAVRAQIPQLLSLGCERGRFVEC